MSPEWRSEVEKPGEQTQRRIAREVVPDLSTLTPRAKPLTEGSEDGHIPSGELERLLAEMATLLKYGHIEQVRSMLERIRSVYPEDLLLLRRISEFYVAHAHAKSALDALFALASKLFERRNVEGMRQSLEQIRVIDPGNERALRLLTLIEQRT